MYNTTDTESLQKAFFTNTLLSIYYTLQYSMKFLRQFKTDNIMMRITEFVLPNVVPIADCQQTCSKITNANPERHLPTLCKLQLCDIKAKSNDETQSLIATEVHYYQLRLSINMSNLIWPIKSKWACFGVYGSRATNEPRELQL